MSENLYIHTPFVDARLERKTKLDRAIAVFLAKGGVVEVIPEKKRRKLLARTAA